MEIRILKDEQDKIMGLLMAISQEFPESAHDLLQLARSAQRGITVEILPLKTDHTRQQENYYRQWCREFGAFCGYTPDQMHEILLRKCYGSEYTEGRLGAILTAAKRSSDAKRDEYSELIETLCRTAAGMGFVVPPPIRKRQETSHE